MIYLEKNTTNRFVLTLTESSTISNPNYLFEFVNQYNPDAVPIYFTTNDLSNYTERYNLFELIENISGSTSGGTSVPLSLMSGEYIYKAYESSASTLSISATTGVIIEQGIMVVDDTTINDDFIDEVIPSQNNTTPSIYD